MKLKARVTKAAMAVSIAIAVVTGATMPRAEAAVDPATLIAVAKTAYGAYQALKPEEDVAAAAAKIITAINSAKSQIIGHIDALALAEAEACARNALSGLENLQTMTKTTAQQFALGTEKCVETIYGHIKTFADKGAVDRAGFALNTVGPIALVAYHHAEFTGVATLKSSLRAANQALITRLQPSCQATPLLGDAEPGGIIEVMLRCKAYNGDVGTDTAFVTSPTGNTYNFTLIANQATRNTSRALAQAVLPKI